MKTEFEEFFLVLCYKLQTYGLPSSTKRCLPVIQDGFTRMISPWSLFLYDLSFKSDLKPFLDELEFGEYMFMANVSSDHLVRFGQDEEGLFSRVNLKNGDFISLSPDGLKEVRRILGSSENRESIQKAVGRCCSQYIDYAEEFNFIVDMCSHSMRQSEIDELLAIR